ncbi:MAG: hypothetical protein H0U69_10420, partial [Trueperaceae bacterium]|nr:hypothetical protein [Trueperaceae bacterium]
MSAPSGADEELRRDLAKVTPRPRLSRALRLAAVMWLLLAGCGQLVPVDPDPVEPPATISTFDLWADMAIAAGEVTIAHVPGAELERVVALTSGVLVEAATGGVHTRVAWVRAEGVEGRVVRIAFALPEGAAEPTLHAVHAYADSGSADVGAGGLSLRAAVGPTLPAPPPAPMSLAHPRTTILSAHFADHALGDMTASGSIGVGDALRVMEMLASGEADAFDLYHSDLDGDDVTDLDDVALLLAKVVDPTLPAGLHVKPRHLSYVQLDPATDRPGIVLVGNRGNAPLASVVPTAPMGVTFTEAGGIEGHSLALSLAMQQPLPKGWLPSPLVIAAGADGVREVMLGHVVVLIAGQSNAVGIGHHEGTWPELPDPEVRMLGNDYLWKDASEALDDNAGQVDLVSDDPTARYSMGTYLGHLLRSTFGVPAYMIPSAKSGSEVAIWRPSGNRVNRNNLFGSANFRAHVSSGAQPNPVTANTEGAEGGPLSVLVWYQGEAENTLEKQARYVEYTDTVMDVFFEEHGAPTVFVQLATDFRVAQNLRHGAVAELQRRMESASGESESRDAYFMVVANDLPRAERNHLSSFGLRILAERIDLAIREHVLAHDVDGTGPRLAGLHVEGDTVVVVRTTRTLEAGTLDA